MKNVVSRGKKHWPALLIIGAGILAGCGDQSTHTSSSSTTQQGPTTYLSAIVASGNPGLGSAHLTAFQIDDTKKTFAQSTFSAYGSQLNSAGSFTGLARGLLNLGLSYSAPVTATGSTNAITSNLPTRNWAIELAGQAGGLVQLNGQPFVPLVAAQSCPGSSSQTFQFVTIPAPLTTKSGVEQSTSWNPDYDTAYGSVAIGGSGSTVNFSNIAQYTYNGKLLTSYQTLANTPAAVSSQSGTCSQTYYGNTISVPTDATLTVGSTGGQLNTPAAIVGVGPSGLLVENNGLGSASVSGIGSVSVYQPFLGAGTGAIGLPKPSSAISTSALFGAQYIGFFYGSGSSAGNSAGWSSQVAAFGSSSLPSSCQSVAAQTPTMIYGGDFANNDPSAAAVQAQANGGFGNCDVAIDMGEQDSANNGLFPAAKVWVGTGYAGNTTNKPYSFPAVAIAGQLGGKYAIFLIGYDNNTVGNPNQAWGIYLLQSN